MKPIARLRLTLCSCWAGLLTQPWRMHGGRCLQVHECLGRLPAFQEAYQRNRRLQLNSDLAPPQQFLDGYQAFVAQLTGFFVIEDRVQRRCPALSGGAQVPLISCLPSAC